MWHSLDLEGSVPALPGRIKEGICLPLALTQALSALCGISLYVLSRAAFAVPSPLQDTMPSRRDSLAVGSLVAALVFWKTAQCESLTMGSQELESLNALSLLPSLVVASASDLSTLSVPDTIWAASVAGRILAGLVSGWPAVDMSSFAVFLVFCATAVYLPGPARTGGADIAALITAAMFVGWRRALCIAWISCVLALSSSLGSKIKYVPFMPYLLCGTCLSAIQF